MIRRYGVQRRLHALGDAVVIGYLGNVQTNREAELLGL